MKQENICEYCGKEMELNQKWDQEYDRLDINTPSADLVRKELYDMNIPKYICECGHRKLVK